MGAGGHPTLQCLVARGILPVNAQEVADGEMAKLVLAPDRANVEMSGARALGGLCEEVVVRRFRRWHEQVPEARQRLDVGRAGFKCVDRELKVQDGLGRETRNGRRADVLQPPRHVAKRFLDAPKLGLCKGGPDRVVVENANRWIEPIIERRMPSQLRRCWARLWLLGTHCL